MCCGRSIGISLLLLAAMARMEAAPNDQFAAAIDLGSQVAVSLVVDTFRATRQVGEPVHGSLGSSGTLWWQWVAPGDGVWEVAVTETAPALSSTVAAYSGSNLSELILLGSARDEVLRLPVARGQRVFLALATSAGFAKLDLNYWDAPQNDHFANRTALGSGALYNLKASTQFASEEPNEPQHGAGSTQGPSIWWEWVAPEDGVFYYDLTGTPHDGWLVPVYSGSELSNLTVLVRRLSLAASRTTSLRVRAGQRLIIAAARSSSNAVGELCLNLRFVPQQFNDEVASAIDLGSAEQFAFVGDTIDATHETFPNRRNVWWRWTAPRNGLATVRIVDTPILSSGIFAYRGVPGQALPGRQREVGIRAVAGREYLIEFISNAGEEGPVSLELALEAAPPNDNFMDAIPLTFGPTPVDLTRATVEDREPDPQARQSLWWSWTAPADGLLAVADISNFLEMEVFSGTDLNALVSLGNLYPGCCTRERAIVVGGERYSIAVKPRSNSEATEAGSFGIGFVPYATDNDDFADALDWGAAWSQVGAANFNGTTLEPGEPMHIFRAEGSRWWKWTAPADADLFLTIDEGTFAFPRLAVYTGTSLDQLVEVFNAAAIPILVPVEEGKTYYLAAFVTDLPDQYFEFSLQAHARPHPNDHFAGATVLGSVDHFSQPLLFTGSTVEPGEPDHIPGTTIPHTRWWTWQASVRKNVEVSYDSAFDDLVAVYRGNSLDSLELVGAEWDTPATVRFAAEPGEVFHIVLGDDDPDRIGDWELRTWTPPVGDRFDDPIDLGSVEMTRIEQSTGLATFSPGDPGTGRSLWWRWVPPANGYLDLEFLLNNGLRFFRGSSLESLQERFQSEFVQAGEEYRFLLDARPQIGAPLQFYAAPPNDAFDNAIDLGSAISAALGPFRDAAGSVEVGEAALIDPDAPEGELSSTWWRWTAPFFGVLSFDERGQNDQLIRVYRGNSIASLEGVDSIPPRFPARFSVPVEEGRSYMILWAATERSISSARTINLSAAPSAANDVWARAVDLGQAEMVSASGSNVGATLESFESEGAASVWWKWTAPRDGSAYFVAEMEEGTEEVRVYRDDGAGSLAPLSGGSLFDPAGEGPGIGWEARAGETDYLSVSGRSVFDVGNIEIGVHLLDPPANDHFENATQLPAVWNAMAEGTTVGAFLQAEEPDHAAGMGWIATGSVWYGWTAPADGLVIGELSDSPGNTLAVYAGGALELLEEVVRVESGVAGWMAEAGRQYRIAVVARDGTPGNIALTLRSEIPATNDDLANRIQLGAGLPQSVSGHNFASTAEPHEAAGSSSVWYQWTALEDGLVLLDATASPTELHFAVFTGSDPASLVAVASGETKAGFLAATGVSYLVSVDSGSGDPGYLNFDLIRGEVPDNDMFANRRVIGEIGERLTGDLTFATREPGEAHAGIVYRTVWWEWTAPASGMVTFPIESGLPPEIRAYRLVRPDLGLGTGGVVLLNESGGAFQVTSGLSYGFQIGSPTETGGGCFEVRLEVEHFQDWRPPYRPPNDDFADRIILPSKRSVRAAAVDIVNLTNEVGEDFASFDRGVWWSWTAPADGTYVVDVAGTVAHSVVVFVGDEFERLREITRWDLDTPQLLSAQEGFEYQISVRSRTPSSFFPQSRNERMVGFDIRPAPPPPANDDFENQQSIGSAVGIPVWGHNIDATAEVDEPAHGGSAAEQSVWYEWEAPSSGRFEVVVRGPAMRMGIYQGDFVSALSENASGTTSVQFSATAGELYQIALDLAAAATFSLSIDPAAPPPSPNDEFDGAGILTGEFESISANNLESTFEVGEPLHGGARTSAGSVWWSWIAERDGPVTISAAGSSAIVAVYTGAAQNSVRPVISSEQEVRFVAEAGVRYRIAVAGVISSHLGTFDLTLDQTSPGPSNDNFSAAAPISGPAALVGGTTADASWELGEPRHHDGAGSCPRSVWYTWECPESGTYQVSHDRASAECLAVYLGDDLDSLIPVAVGGRVIEFSATAGMVYRVAVADSSGDSTFNLSLGPREDPENDHFVNRILLPPDLPLDVRSSNLFASAEPGEPFHGGHSNERSVWWEWTSPVDAWVEFDVSDSGNTIVGGVYSGPALPFLSPVDGDCACPQSVRFRASVGATYVMALASTEADGVGAISFELRLSRDRPGNDDFEDAFSLVGESARGTSHSWGATEEPGEPAELENSLWWKWTAPRSGWVNLFGEFGTVALYTGDELPTLAEVERLPLGEQRYRVAGGQRYWIASSADANREVTVALDMGPAGDLFEFPIPLAPSRFLRTSATLASATWEEYEPFHSGGPAAQSVWFKWVPPTPGEFLIRARNSRHQLRIAVYKGTNLIGLCPVGDGIGELRVEVEPGVEHRIAIDTPRGPLSDSNVDLLIEPGSSPYGTWRDGFFGAGARDSFPLDDPDRDGRFNLFEMALATNPLVHDPSETPFTVEERWGFLLLSVVRPKDVPGIVYSFEVSRTLDGDWMWSGDLDRALWAEDNGDGTETFYMVLTEFRPQDEPHIFARLRVELGEDPLDP